MSPDARVAATTPRTAALAKQEHEAFIELVSGLGEGALATASLCAGWTVRDVIVHVAGHIHHSVAASQRLRDLARSGGRPDRAATLEVRRHETLTRGELLAWLAAPMPLDARNLETDQSVQLAELVIHHQDIRRALDQPRALGAEPLRLLLEWGMTRLGSIAVAGARRRGRGLTVIATDLSWHYGTGPEVEGPGEALLLALNGRPAALADLEGPGLSRLRARLRSTS